MLTGWGLPERVSQVVGRQDQPKVLLPEELDAHAAELGVLYVARMCHDVLLEKARPDEVLMELPQPFFVLATQNPIEQEGTYPLPEAQVDRFLLKIVVDYPGYEDELTVVHRALGDPAAVRRVIEPERLAELQAAVRRVYVDPRVTSYAVSLVLATREPGRHGLDGIAPFVSYGASPRASPSAQRIRPAMPCSSANAPRIHVSDARKASSSEEPRPSMPRVRATVTPTPSATIARESRASRSCSGVGGGFAPAPRLPPPMYLPKSTAYHAPELPFMAQVVGIERELTVAIHRLQKLATYRRHCSFFFNTLKSPMNSSHGIQQARKPPHGSTAEMPHRRGEPLSRKAGSSRQW